MSSNWLHCPSDFFRNVRIVLEQGLGPQQFIPVLEDVKPGDDCFVRGPQVSHGYDSWSIGVVKQAVSQSPSVADGSHVRALLVKFKDSQDGQEMKAWFHPKWYEIVSAAQFTRMASHSLPCISALDLNDMFRSRLVLTPLLTLISDGNTYFAAPVWFPAFVEYKWVQNTMDHFAVKFCHIRGGHRQTTTVRVVLPITQAPDLALAMPRQHIAIYPSASKGYSTPTKQQIDNAKRTGMGVINFPIHAPFEHLMFWDWPNMIHEEEGCTDSLLDQQFARMPLYDCECLRTERQPWCTKHCVSL